jgi:hypothetical protein
MSLVTPRTLLFKWTRPRAWQKARRIRYVLRIYDDSKRLLAGSTRRELVYERAVEDSDAFRFAAGEVPLVSGRMYLWEVAAYDRAGRILAVSAPSRIGYRTDFPVVTLPRPSLVYARRPDFVPAAPFVWGCPLVARFRTAIDAPPVPEPELEPEGSGGGVVPKGITWGSPGAFVFLISQTWTRCNLRWDYSDIPGCERVILQIAADGFEYPGHSPEVLSDPAVAVALEGPASTVCSVSEDLDLVRLENPTQMYSTQAFNLLSEDFWDEWPDTIWLRLVPLRADGALADMASDPTVVFVLQECPGLKLRNCDVTWTWGEAPRRVIDFELELGGAFSTGLFAPPTAFIIGTYAINNVNVEMTIDSRPIVQQSRIEGAALDYQAYVFEADDWEDGRVYRGRLVQEMLHHSAYTISPLVDFIEAKLDARCYPGIGIDWAYCGGPMTQESCRLPRLGPASQPSPTECARPLNDYFRQSAWDQVFAYFDSTFTGTRTVTKFEERRYPPEDGDVTDPASWRVERDEVDRLDEEITVRFGWPGNPRDGDAFCGSFWAELAEPATMSESVGSTARLYDFLWWGDRASLTERTGACRRYFGETPYEEGTIVVGIPDHLEMHFRCGPEAEDEAFTSWEGDHAVYRYEVIDYALSC